MYDTQRTGVRLVLTNVSDPTRVNDYSDWYESYGVGLIHTGFLANDFRFENPSAAADEADPRFVALYDICTPDPATAWPDAEQSSEYPTALFEDPRSALVDPVLRASYALVGSHQTPVEHGTLTGVYLTLTDGSDDTSRQKWSSQVLGTGFFYAASRFRLIEGNPEPPEWLEVFETDQQDPLAAYAQALEVLTPNAPATNIRPQETGSFRLVSAYPPSPSPEASRASPPTHE
jgi:hypothetical protein